MKWFCYVVAILFAATALGAPPGLVVAYTAEYSTSILAEATPALTSPITLNFSLCGVGPASALLTVTPGGANVVRNVGVGSCLPPFALFAAPPPTVKAVSVIRFNNGKDRSSFTLPPIGAILGDQVIRLGPLVSDAEEGSFITLFPVSAATPFLVTLFDAKGVLPPVTELFRAEPPVAQYRIAATGVFWLELQLGYGIPAPYGCWPLVCGDYGTIYGFASSGTPDGGSFRAYPFPVTP